MDQAREHSGMAAEPHGETTGSGIAPRDTRVIADALAGALADSFILYLKTLGVHWNVVGSNFYGLHKLTETQYEDIDAAIDAMAERIRALGHITPASFGDYSSRSALESQTTLSTVESMLNCLVADNETIARRMREAVRIADDADDVYTADMLTARIGKHEQNAWMLRAMTA